MFPPPDHEFLELIRKLRARIRRLRQKALNEQDTKSALINPMLTGLGWDVENPEEVKHEFRHTGRDCPVDFSLNIMHRPRLFLEAKALGEDLTRREWLRQALTNATMAGIDWCVMTDGDEYRFLRAHDNVPAEEREFCRVKLSDDDEVKAAQTLTMISRRNLEQNLIDTLWTSYHVDTQVRAAVVKLFAPPSTAIARILQRRGTGLSERQIAESIQRLGVAVGTPMVIPENGQAAVSARMVRARGKKAAKPWLTASVSARPTLPEIVRAGLLKASTPLVAHYRGRDLKARVGADGRVEFQGKMYATCSMAAGVAKSTVSGKQSSTNGWKFWRIESPDGERRALNSIRPDGPPAADGELNDDGLFQKVPPRPRRSRSR